MSQNLRPLVQAIQEATGVRCHLSTAIRWTQRGSRGVVLKSWFLGGKRLTTVQAVLDFIEARTALSNAPLTRREQSQAQRDAAIARAELELKEAGI